MDVNDIRSLLTVLMFLTFVGIVAWAYSARRKPKFEEAANLPFNDPNEPDNASSGCEERKV